MARGPVEETTGATGTTGTTGGEFERSVGMSEKQKWMGFLTFGDDLKMETAGISDAAYRVYMDLMMYSRNQKHPGNVEMMIRTLAIAGTKTAEKTWEALKELLSMYGVQGGQRLVRLWVEEGSLEGWREVQERSDEPMPTTQKVRVQFMNVQKMVDEWNEKNRQRLSYDAERQRNKRIKDGSSGESHAVTVTNRDSDEVTNGHSDIRPVTAKRREEKRIGEDINTPVVPKGTVLEKWFSEVFWPAYPRKVKKPQAWKAAKGALKKVEADRIMGALERAKEGDHRFQEARFTPYPASWLNEEPWGNEEIEGKAEGVKAEGRWEKNQKSAAGELLIGMPPAGAE